MTDLILHHYNESPYAEKARLMLGHKGLAWRSVKVPRIAPKPDLVALTGGYRKVPVLQIGADVYCDTTLMAEVLDQRHPAPTLAPQPGGCAELVSHWVDTLLFGRAVTYTFGKLAPVLPDALLADRAALRGAPLERDALQRAVPLAEQELHVQLTWLERVLAGGQAYFNGSAPANGDFTLYATLWFLQAGGFSFAALPGLSAWMGRMADFGHGQREDIDAETALAAAAAATPMPIEASTFEDASGLQHGQPVQVAPEQLGHGTSVQGTLVALSHTRMTLAIDSERCGQLHVHFPRMGYRLRAA